MSAQTRQQPPIPEEQFRYRSILLAVDASDHANRGIREAVNLASCFGSRLTAVHVYAAKLHDMRFRQMEGGLPEQFRQETELERQRQVHDDLITRGLSIITGAYLDQAEKVAAEKDIRIHRRALEGKNYRELATEANNGNYDLLIMGARGLGAVKGSRLGTVCRRLSRRSRIDTLIIREPQYSLAEGPIVVAVDGSPKSWGGLLTALELARAWNAKLKVISAFDPYYHYVAFNRIAGVLSEEAGQVFRFQEQEQLHEEIIDSGLAKIYRGHLAIAQAMAEEQGMEVETVLLDGKPHEVITRYLKDIRPSLLVLGTTGIHADEALDIGGNAEQLLEDAPCALLLSQREYQPGVDQLASVTTSWTHEAEARMDRVPSFVRGMARMAILRYAQEKGHTVITEGIVKEATARLMPGHAEKALEEIVNAHDRGRPGPPPAMEAIRWSEEAKALLLDIPDPSLRGNLSLRAEKKARQAGSPEVLANHLRAFLGNGMDNTEPSGQDSVSLHWQAAALARLMRVPEGFMRDRCRKKIEAAARKQGLTEITLQIVEAGLESARSAMQEPQSAEQFPAASRCPFAGGRERNSDNPHD